MEADAPVRADLAERNHTLFEETDEEGPRGVEEVGCLSWSSFRRPWRHSSRVLSSRDACACGHRYPVANARPRAAIADACGSRTRRPFRRVRSWGAPRARRPAPRPSAEWNPPMEGWGRARRDFPPCAIAQVVVLHVAFAGHHPPAEFTFGLLPSGTSRLAQRHASPVAPEDARARVDSEFAHGLAQRALASVFVHPHFAPP